MARVLPLLEPAHLDRDFDYLVPPEMDGLAQPGVRVRVRFSGRLVDGYLLERLEKSDHTGKLVRLERVVSGERVLTPEILKLVTAVAARYAGTRADVLRLAIPPRHAKVESEGTEKPEHTSKKGPGAAADAATSATLGTAEHSAVRPGPHIGVSGQGPGGPGCPAQGRVAGGASGGAGGNGATADPIRDSDACGTGEVTRAADVESASVPARGHAGAVDAIAQGDPIAGAPGAGVHSTAPVAALVPTGELGQQPAAAASRTLSAEFPAWGRYVHGHSFSNALAVGRGPRAGWQALPGEDWGRRLAELAAVTVRGGRSAVIMVPDQRDLDRVLAECVTLVGELAVGLAAGLGPAARYRRWLSVLRGNARVVVGTRSAVFSPVKDLGLIALWDDGDSTFAEPRSPYPHAREVAMLRAHETGAAFLAGGFSRTAEVQAIVESGWAHDLLADRTVLRQAMPRITAPGDTDAALERDPIAQAIRIPAVAFMEARKALEAGGPVLVQVPRRGYIPALSCAKCRTPARCRHCNGPLALPDTAPASRGALRSGRGGVAEAQSPACRWCGITEAAFRCGVCGSRALRAVVIGASRTAEELGRAFPGVPLRGSGGSSVLSTVPEGPQIVVSTIGAEPRVPGGYAVAMLLDGWALLGRADLRAAEDALRRWMSAAALVRPDGRVIVMADAALPTVQALVRWDPVWHASFELEQRSEVRFPPAVRFVAIDGTADSIAELLGEAQLPGGVEILGPVPLPPGARKPFSSGDSPAEVERIILRADRATGSALSRALTVAQAVRSTHRSDAPLRVQIDPIDIG
ncbi:primosomal protein N' [Nocardia sp. CT2-14]|uniref:Probable replication restart protein PriA n=1 Tax=Nocardia aurantiaca TaxID=2675850 RepID=A0A6I3L368_9NOCA|nr:primosomal protein N' [Nocardia aurantiaca]